VTDLTDQAHDRALWAFSVLNARRECAKYIRWAVRAVGIGALVYLAVWIGVLIVAAFQNILIFRPTVSSSMLGVITNLLLFAVSGRQVFQRQTPPFLVNRLETAVFSTAPVSIWQLVRLGVFVQVIAFFVLAGALLALLLLLNPPVTPIVFLVQWIGACAGVSCVALHRIASHFALLERRSAVPWTLVLPFIAAVLVAITFVLPGYAALLTFAVYVIGSTWLAWFVWRQLNSAVLPNCFVYKLNLKAELDSSQFLTALSNTAPSKTVQSLRRALNDAPIPDYRHDYTKLVKPLERHDVFAVKALLTLKRSGARELGYGVLNIAFFVAMIVLESPLFDPARHVLLIVSLIYFLKRLYRDVSLPRIFPVNAHHAFVFDAQPKIAFVFVVYLLLGLLFFLFGWGVHAPKFAVAFVIHLTTFLLLLRAKTSAKLDEHASETHMIVANLAALPLMFAKILNLFEFALVFYAVFWLLSTFDLVSLSRRLFLMAARFIRP
jgi:hypothetical protein